MTKLGNTTTTELQAVATLLELFLMKYDPDTGYGANGIPDYKQIIYRHSLAITALFGVMVQTGQLDIEDLKGFITSAENTINDMVQRNG